MLNKLFTTVALIMFLNIGVTHCQLPPNPPLNAGERWTDLWSVSYDYQTNGGVRYLVQDPANPANWCAILMAQQDSTTPSGSQRYIYYSYSDDNGLTWSSNVLDVSSNYGFPCITLRNGIPVIATHISAVGSFVFQDLLFGGFAFAQITGIPVPLPPPIWPHIAGTTNGNLVLVASPNDGSFFSQRATYTTSWSAYVQSSLIGGPSGNFDVSAGPNGRAAIIGYDNLTGLNLTYFLSNNNGVTFDNGNIIAPYIIDGSDTLFFNVVGGYQSVFDNSGNLHIVTVAYNQFDLDPFVFNTTRFVKPRIYHWSQATGFVQVAGRSNIPTLTDTLTQVLQAPVTQPTITITPSGKLVCAFTAFLRGNKQVVQNGDLVNAGEIFSSFSNDNGATWSTPANLTNTPLIEEKHPSLPSSIDNNDNMRIYYLRDMRAGGWVINPDWGKAPVYGIFKTFRAASPTIELRARQVTDSATITNQLVFDIFIRNCSQNPLVDTFAYGTCQYGFNFNSGILNGGTASVVIIPGFSDIPNVAPTSVSDTIVGDTLRVFLPGNLPVGLASPLIPGTFPGVRVVRVMLSTSAPSFAQIPIVSRFRLVNPSATEIRQLLNVGGIPQLDLNPLTYCVPPITEFQTGVLPVELASFTSSVQRNNVTLNWTTSKETNNSGFDVERKLISASEWTKVGNVSGNGSTNESESYIFFDRINTGRYNYTLKQIDFNGNFQHFQLSNEVEVGVPDKYNMSQNYPNPFNPTTKIDYDISYDGKVSIVLYDVTGREVANLVNEVKTAGYYSAQFNASNLASGMYFYRITAQGNNNNFVMTKKMMLIK